MDGSLAKPSVLRPHIATAWLLAASCKHGSECAAGLSSSGRRQGMRVAKYCTGTMLPIRNEMLTR